MNDHFTLLEQPRRPWLDPQEVQAKFLARSAEVHPDRVHQASSSHKASANERFAALNSACHCLRDSKERLRHLLELELGAPLKPLERLPSEAADMFFEFGRACSAVDEFLAKKERTGPTLSPLIRVRLFEDAMAWREQLEQLQGKLEAQRTALETEIKSLNKAWELAPPPESMERQRNLPLDRLEQIYREFSYLTRWSEQIRERILRLSL